MTNETEVVVPKADRSKPIKFLIWLGGVFGLLLLKRFFQPIIDWIYTLPGSFFSGWVDGLYATAANGQRDWVAVLIFATAVWTGYFFTVIMALGLHVPPRAILSSRLLGDGSNPKKSFDRLRVLIWILLVCLLPMQINLTAGPIVDISLNTRFQRELNILAPYVPQQEILIARSNWGLMQSVVDHERIEARLKQLADSVHITLPGDRGK